LAHWYNHSVAHDGKLYHCRCFVKSINDARVVIAVIPLLFSPVPQSSLRDSSDAFDLIDMKGKLDGSRFAVLFYECRRDQLFTKHQSSRFVRSSGAFE
jgi:hypothetical protein